MLAKTLGELKRTYPDAKLKRTVKEEIRANLIQRLKAGDPLFPGIHGYEDSVVPAIVNAVLAGHDFILLGTRGQAKSRLVRVMAELLDPLIPALPTPLRDNPLAPASPEGRRLLAEAGDDAPIVWIEREARLVEKLATPDTNVADLIGDLDPIKAARRGEGLSDLEALHYGLILRANRGIFAIHELPDLAPKVQVALFDVLQERLVQIRGFPVKLALDVWLVFTANPEDYTTRGRIITPLKDRIEAEIHTHDPKSLEVARAITAQEARWPGEVQLPEFLARAVERVAFLARTDPRVEPSSGVSQRLSIALLETVGANALRRSLIYGDPAVARPVDLYRALPAITGKLEPSFEGEQVGVARIAKDLIAKALLHEARERGSDLEAIKPFFAKGKDLELPEGPWSEVKERLGQVPGLVEAGRHLDPQHPWVGAEAVLEALVGEGFLVRESGRFKRP